MKHVLLLAWRYLAYHRARTLLLVFAVALAFAAPIAVNALLATFGDALLERARATPLVVGARGSRFDLVLNGLYFQGRVPRTLRFAEAAAVDESGLARAIPLLVRHTARRHPVAGVGFDYFAFRGLRPARGDLPQRLGDAVLGADAARDLGIGPGDRLLTDRGSLYDLTLAAPVRLLVTGVLAPTGTPDDRAVFVDVRTAWLVEGIAHGHAAADEVGAERVLARKPDEVVLDASVPEYVEVTDDNVDRFHFHGDRDDFPLTALLVLPRDAKATTLLKGRYRVSETAQALVPVEVIEEILGFVVRLKAFFDANFALVAAATASFLALVVLLTLRARRDEIDTLRRLGCARATVFRLLATEFALVTFAGLLLAALGAAAVLLATDPWAGTGTLAPAIDAAAAGG